MRLGYIYMTSPNPFVIGFLFYQGNRLRVVYNYDVARDIDFINILLAGFHENIEILLSDFILFAVEDIVKFLSDGKEISPPLIKSQRASRPSSFINGTIRVRISATPPPTAVEFMC